MPRVCQTCVHPSRRALEDQALAGIGPLELSKRFGLHPVAIKRHLKAHVARDVKSAAKARNGLAGNSLLDRIQESRTDLQRILKTAEGTQELAVAVNAIQGGLRALELEGRLTGELSSGGTSINIALGVRMDVAQARLGAYDAARTLPAESVIERAAQVLRAACESGDERAHAHVTELQRALPRALPPSEATVIE